MNSLPKTVTRQRRDCDLNPGPSAPESSTLTTRLPSRPGTKGECKGKSGRLDERVGGGTLSRPVLVRCLAVATWRFLVSSRLLKTASSWR